MPSGYTAALYDGKDQTFTDFALNCARAFGALILLRDEPNAPIPDEFPPSEHDKRWRDEVLTKVLTLERRTTDEWADAQRTEVAEHNAHVARAIEQATTLRRRYDRMLADVRAWQLPTAEHEGLKAFMISQLEESISFDCSTSHLIAQEEKPLQDYIDQALRTARHQHERAEQAWQAEQSRAKGRTSWVRALRASLPTD